MLEIGALAGSRRARYQYKDVNLPGRLGRWCALPLWVPAAVGAAAVSIASTAALAAPPPRVPARLSWGASVCGDARGFASRVLKRTRAVRFVERGEALTVHLSIAPEGSGLDATVSLISKGREPIVRHIASPDCDDALDALALVVAISLEARSREVFRRAPRRSSAPRARPAPPPASPVPTPTRAVPLLEPVAPAPGALPATEAASPATSDDAVLPAVAAEGSASPAAASAPVAEAARGPVVVTAEPPALVGVEALVPPSEPRASERLAFASGVSAQLLVGAAPEALIGAQLWARARWERGSAWSPELGLSIAHQRRDGFDDAAGQADFALTSTSLDVCPVRLGSAAWHVQPCVAGALGQLESEGRATFLPGRARRPWATLGGNIQLVARVAVLEIRGSFGVARPFVRDAFHFGPSCESASCEADIFHRVEAAVWLAALGAGVNF